MHVRAYRGSLLTSCYIPELKQLVTSAEDKTLVFWNCKGRGLVLPKRYFLFYAHKIEYTFAGASRQVDHQTLDGAAFTDSPKHQIIYVKGIHAV